MTGTFVDYALPSAADVPSFETDRTETPSPVNSLGVKGVGEAGTIAASPRDHQRGHRRAAPARRRLHQHAAQPQRVGGDPGGRAATTGSRAAVGRARERQRRLRTDSPRGRSHDPRRVRLRRARRRSTRRWPRSRDGGEDAKVLAGGHSLLPLMKLRLAAPSLLVDLRRRRRADAASRAPTAAGPDRRDDDRTRRSSARRTSGSRRRGASTIADPQVRNRGTIGGSLAHGDPASDLPAVLLAYEGSVIGPRAERRARDRGRRPVRGLPHDRRRRRRDRSPRSGCPALDGYGFGYQKFNRRQRGLGDGRRLRAGQEGAATASCEDVRVGAHEHGLRAAAGDRGRGGAARQGARRAARSPRPPSRPPRAPSRPATSTPRRTTSATWRAC